MKRRPARAVAPPGPGRIERERSRVLPSVVSPMADPEARNGFVRGFIVAGLVAAVTGEKRAAGGQTRAETLRLALQGGTALAAGIAGANALDRRDYGSALIAVAAGAAGLSAIDYLFTETSFNEKETGDEQERTQETAAQTTA
ncbi:MAG: hypothetical protein LBQ62_02730 [Candidatus Accumulibacter sp.]|jgi:hypothetical protein|nr:hypothetical protein [Accumulibacter sp.]